MVALFEQALTLGRVEHQLTRFSYGALRPIPESGSGEYDVSWILYGAIYSAFDRSDDWVLFLKYD